MPVFTISSQFGAGASDVGRRVADRLRLRYVDQSVLVDAARELGVSIRSLEKHDEKVDSFRERMVRFLQRALEHSAAVGSVDPLMGAGNLELMLSEGYEDMMESSKIRTLNDETYRTTVSNVITDLASEGSLVVIGRGGQMILIENPGTIHVQLVAEEEIRIRRVMQWLSLSSDEARKRIRRFNQSRTDFHRKFWNVDVWDPRLYDLVINTTHLSYEAAADCIISVSEELSVRKSFSVEK